jgi:hypothetical protein
MKSAEEIADEAYQIIGSLARVANIDVANRDVIRALDYFSAIANGDEVDEILPWSLHSDSG